MILQGLICVVSQLLGTIIFICSIGMVQFNSRIFTFSDFIQVFWASYNCQIFNDQDAMSWWDFCNCWIRLGSIGHLNFRIRCKGTVRYIAIVSLLDVLQLPNLQWVEAMGQWYFCICLIQLDCVRSLTVVKPSRNDMQLSNGIFAIVGVEPFTIAEASGDKM